MNVILDTNIWISFLLGKRLQNVESVFQNADVRVYVSQDLIAELVSVLARPKIRRYVSSDSIEAMWTLIRNHCYVIEDYPIADSKVRDIKDVYLLSMAQAIPADIIVTGDKDLLVLGKCGNTLILPYSEGTLKSHFAQNQHLIINMLRVENRKF